MIDETDREPWALLTRSQITEAVEYATSRPYRRMYRRAMRAERALRRLREAVRPFMEEARCLPGHIPDALGYRVPGVCAGDWRQLKAAMEGNKP